MHDVSSVGDVPSGWQLSIRLNARCTRRKGVAHISSMLMLFGDIELKACDDSRIELFG